jgi:hypothetical protein
VCARSAANRFRGDAARVRTQWMTRRSERGGCGGRAPREWRANEQCGGYARRVSASARSARAVQRGERGGPPAEAREPDERGGSARGPARAERRRRGRGARHRQPARAKRAMRAERPRAKRRPQRTGQPLLRNGAARAARPTAPALNAADGTRSHGMAMRGSRPYRGVSRGRSPASQPGRCPRQHATAQLRATSNPVTPEHGQGRASKGARLPWALTAAQHVLRTGKTPGYLSRRLQYRTIRPIL